MVIYCLFSSNFCQQSLTTNLDFFSFDFDFDTADHVASFYFFDHLAATTLYY